MFSGIIEKTGRVKSARRKEQTLVLEIESGFFDLELGESVAVNGVCLTIIEYDQSGLAVFFVSSETTKRSNLGALGVGDKVNLERAVRLETRLSGHLVQGHVDGRASLVWLVAEQGAYRAGFLLPNSLGRFCIEKGSIALNGVSLTINGIKSRSDDQSEIQITIIEHTWVHTNLGEIGIGDEVNVEVDVIAKYVEKLCHPYPKP
ncbi:Riboflavin synthase eubacterial/eukaryotic [hydrothermal vent metagenome]|uniref:Riboflavin synthase eubacterial/eukaryotic n=1 Tax=hydrothermal vent metagenome TaxID=652676 RepID=A0A3B0TUW8_9ZZZZ